MKFTIKNIQIEIIPYFHWFWRFRDRYKDHPDIVNVCGGGPFFQYEYYTPYCPKKHKGVKILGLN